MVKRAASRASSASARDAKNRRMTAEQLPNKKLADNYRDMDSEETDVVVSPSTGLTCRVQLVRDCRRWLAGEEVGFGPAYHQNVRGTFKKPVKWFEALKPSTEGETRTALVKVIY